MEHEKLMAIIQAFGGDKRKEASASKECPKIHNNIISIIVRYITPPSNAVNFYTDTAQCLLCQWQAPCTQYH